MVMIPRQSVWIPGMKKLVLKKKAMHRCIYIYIYIRPSPRFQYPQSEIYTFFFPRN